MEIAIIVCASLLGWYVCHKCYLNGKRDGATELENKFRTKPSEVPFPTETPTSEVERLRAYIARLTENKRNHQLRRPDLMAQTFLAFNDEERAAFFNRLALRLRVEQGALRRRQQWKPMIERMHFDALFLLNQVLDPMVRRELTRLWDIRPRIAPQRDGDEQP